MEDQEPFAPQLSQPDKVTRFVPHGHSNRNMRRRAAAQGIDLKETGKVDPASPLTPLATNIKTLEELTHEIVQFALRSAFARLANNQVDFAIAALMKAGARIAIETGKGEHAVRCFAADIAPVATIALPDEAAPVANDDTADLFDLDHMQLSPMAQKLRDMIGDRALPSDAEIEAFDAAGEPS